MVWVVLGSWMGLISHSVHFASQVSHHASDLVAEAGMILEDITSFAKQRGVQKSSQVTGYTVATVLPVGSTN